MDSGKIAAATYMIQLQELINQISFLAGEYSYIYYDFKKKYPNAEAAGNASDEEMIRFEGANINIRRLLTTTRIKIISLSKHIKTIENIETKTKDIFEKIITGNKVASFQDLFDYASALDEAFVNSEISELLMKAGDIYAETYGATRTNQNSQ